MAMMAEEAGERLMNIKRQLEIGGGIALVGISAFLAVSAATWNVNDPSWSQSNRNLIENAAGGSGAVAADLMMQILGLGAAPVHVAEARVHDGPRLEPRLALAAAAAAFLRAASSSASICQS